MLPFNYYIGLAVSLYVVGLYILISKRNMIKMIMGIEIMLFASNILFMAISSMMKTGFVDPYAQSVVIISIVVGAAIAALAIALVVYAYKLFGTTDVRKLSELKG